MYTLSYKGLSWSVDHAVKRSNYVRGYAADGHAIVSIEENPFSFM